jgi:DNA-directed RNA polymerase subunit RPC12/RpoP
MSVLLECSGCQTRYDVAKRAPGDRVRCPRCKTNLLVPERTDPEDAPRPEAKSARASSRLRMARGPVCGQHPKAQADHRCASCGGYVCSKCMGPAPVDHHCVPCVEEHGLGPALPLDAGPIATPLLAARTLLRALPRILSWNLLSFLGTLTVFLIPAALGAYAWNAIGEVPEAAFWDAMKRQVAGGVVVGAALGAVLTYYVLLIPSGCAVFMDLVLRERTVDFADAFRDAWWRWVRNMPRLTLALVLLGLVSLPWVVLVLGISYVLFEAQQPVLCLLVLCGGLGVWFVPMMVTLGMTTVVVMLEERGALDALGRAWRLISSEAPLVGLILMEYGAVYALASSLLFLVGTVLGLNLISFVVGAVFDVLWPALLVALYHGLASDDAGVIGRK